MYTLGTLGSPPCPPPEGCPSGTYRNPDYPSSSATCCKPIRGYVAPADGSTTPGPGAPKPQGGTPGPGAPKPTWAAGTTNTDEEGVDTAVPMTAPSPAMPWYQKYKWYLLGGAAVVAVAGTIVAVRAPKISPVTGW